MATIDWLRQRWIAVDWLVACYALWVALLVLWRAAAIPEWRQLVGASGLVLAFLVLVPPRGAAWERRALRRRRHILREIARFLRYVYPLPLMLFFFEEVGYTVNAIYPDDPYWFEPYLYAADQALFGATPALALAPWVSVPLTELMDALYFGYYLILVGGTLIAWRGGRGASTDRAMSSTPTSPPGTPGPGFGPVLTGMTAAFLLAFIFYPWLAARGPWENPELMDRLPPRQGILFTPLVMMIIDRGAVSGGCFPSAHVAGAWGIVVGLGAARRRASRWMALAAVGMSFACVYTRYHHAIDIPTGLVCGLVGGWVGRLSSPVPSAGEAGVSPGG